MFVYCERIQIRTLKYYLCSRVSRRRRESGRAGPTESKGQRDHIITRRNRYSRLPTVSRRTLRGYQSPRRVPIGRPVISRVPGHRARFVKYPASRRPLSTEKKNKNKNNTARTTAVTVSLRYRRWFRPVHRSLSYLECSRLAPPTGADK